MYILIIVTWLIVVDIEDNTVGCCEKILSTREKVVWLNEAISKQLAERCGPSPGPSDSVTGPAIVTMASLTT